VNNNTKLRKVRNNENKKEKQTNAQRHKYTDKQNFFFLGGGGREGHRFEQVSDVILVKSHVNYKS